MQTQHVRTGIWRIGSYIKGAQEYFLIPKKVCLCFRLKRIEDKNKRSDIMMDYDPKINNYDGVIFHAALYDYFNEV